jgi:hypothetical protein
VGVLVEMLLARYGIDPHEFDSGANADSAPSEVGEAVSPYSRTDVAASTGAAATVSCATRAKLTEKANLSGACPAGAPTTYVAEPLQQTFAWFA